MENIKDLKKKLKDSFVLCNQFNKISIILSSIFYFIPTIMDCIFKEIDFTEIICCSFYFCFWIVDYFLLCYRFDDYLEVNLNKPLRNIQDKDNSVIQFFICEIFQPLLLVVFLLTFSSITHSHLKFGYANSLWGEIGYSTGILGKCLNVGTITIIIKDIFLVKSILYLKEIDNIRKEPFREKLRIEQEKLVKQKLAQERILTTKELLNKTGKKFFVDNYEKLKTWDVWDVFDNLENNQQSIERINCGKKIFELNLQKIALYQIINSKNSIDSTTIKKAEELYDKE